MKPVLIFRHVACEGPGYLGEYLARHQIPTELIRVDRGEPVPATLRDVGGLVFMGGPMSVNDSLPWIAAELDLIRQGADAGIPVLGHCLGGQLMSKALGGEVTPAGVREIGWHPVRRVANAAANAWLGTLPEEFTVFHWHGETFSLPPGAQHVLRNETCAHQGFVLDNMLALQCHVEMTAAMVTEWAERYWDEIALPSPTVQSQGEMTARLAERIAASNAAADVLYARWIDALA